ncbi:unnamed protein product [Kuraishia capsulata CBS 1993]|uniref:Uncharacterized protein n=1 Tax=Kuraishia capsulata CBS 1993 TaxID=1382522 RepID=W6MRT2_9ASCO|nr:uncharacterized protein KUCA_T00000485001 [Kuraishia capsulata CBS 1993]CDK24520.1 unnamed protein product [Kuraishia capsulata CBS 1993]
MSVTLISLQRQYLLTQFTSVGSRTKYLVLDERANELIDILFKREELLDYFFSVQTIDSKSRNKEQAQEAFYLLDPSTYSINCLLADFTIKPSRYSRVFLYFFPGLTDAHKDRLSRSSSLQRSIGKLEVLKLGMFPVGNNVFTTKFYDSLQSYYNRSCVELVQSQINQAVESLLNLIVVSEEYPVIRYYRPDDNKSRTSPLPNLIAQQLKQKLEDYIREHEEYRTDSRPRPVLLITDRTMDLYTPIFHSFNYEALVFDTVEFPENKEGKYINEFTYNAVLMNGEKERKRTRLNDTDKYWTQLRKLHFIEAGKVIQQTIHTLRAEDNRMKNSRYVADLHHTLATKDEHMEDKRLIYAHDQLENRLLQIFQDRQLMDLALFEQCCAANGIEEDGTHNKHLTNSLLDLLVKKEISRKDKIRIITSYAIYRGGIIEADLKKLCTFAGFEDYFDVYRVLYKNFGLMGFPLLKADLRQKKINKSPTYYIQSYEEMGDRATRFRPAVEVILQSIIQGNLSESMYPYIDGVAPSTESTKVKGPLVHSSRNAEWSTSQKGREKIFLFVAGGLTHAEIESAYSFSEKYRKDIFLGGDEIHTPEGFLNQVLHLSNDRADLRMPFDIKQENIPAPKHLTVQPTAVQSKPVAQAVPNGPSPKSSISSSTSEIVSSASTEKKSLRKKLFGRKK